MAKHTVGLDDVSNQEGLERVPGHCQYMSRVLRNCVSPRLYNRANKAGRREGRRFSPNMPLEKSGGDYYERYGCCLYTPSLPLRIQSAAYTCIERRPKRATTSVRCNFVFLIPIILLVI